MIQEAGPAFVERVFGCGSITAKQEAAEKFYVNGQIFIIVHPDSVSYYCVKSAESNVYSYCYATPKANYQEISHISNVLADVWATGHAVGIHKGTEIAINVFNPKK